MKSSTPVLYRCHCLFSKKKKKKEKKVGIVIGSWDIDILKGFFASLEVDLILKIPLSPNYVEEKLFWPHTANGVYSVKSGYNFLAKEKSSLSLVSSP